MVVQERRRRKLRQYHGHDSKAGARHHQQLNRQDLPCQNKTRKYSKMAKFNQNEAEQGEEEEEEEKEEEEEEEEKSRIKGGTLVQKESVCFVCLDRKEARA